MYGGRYGTGSPPCVLLCFAILRERESRPTDIRPETQPRGVCCVRLDCCVLSPTEKMKSVSALPQQPNRPCLSELCIPPHLYQNTASAKMDLFRAHIILYLPTMAAHERYTYTSSRRAAEEQQAHSAILQSLSEPQPASFIAE